MFSNKSKVRFNYTALIFAALLILFTTSSCSDSPAISPTTYEFSQEKIEQMETVIKARMEELDIPGTIIGIWSPEQGNWMHAEGKREIATGADATIFDKFRIASITKTFTITILLQLADEGLLSLDDTLDKFFPDKPALAPVTVRQICNMTSGIYNYTEIAFYNEESENNLLKKWEPEELVDIALKEGFYFSPGTGFHYSNTNTILAGMIIEKITGNKIEDEFKSRLFEPLNMNSSFFATDRNINGNHLHGYVNIDGEYIDVTTIFDPSIAWTAGSVVSTLSDLHTWCVALSEGYLLSENMQKERLTWGGYSDYEQYKYCLGICYLGNYLGHDGNYIGYNAIMYYLPSKKAVFIIAVNGEGDGASTMFKDISKIVYPEETVRE